MQTGQKLSARETMQIHQGYLLQCGQYLGFLLNEDLPLVRSDIHIIPADKQHLFLICTFQHWSDIIPCLLDTLFLAVGWVHVGPGSLSFALQQSFLLAWMSQIQGQE